MTVTINGERREIPDGLNVAALLEHLGMSRDRVAIERNLNILPRANWNETRVEPNDTFEIVQFVGGG
jgi:thiamine biosynthesis protein ThiS